MHAVFLVCLVGGLIATALLAALGQVAGHLQIGGHATPHLPSGGHAGGHLPTAHLSAAHAHTTSLPGAHGQVAVQSHMANDAARGAHAVTPATSQGNPGWLTGALGWTLSWFNPLTFAAGALFFGGGGLLAEPASATIALVVAIVAGLLGAAAVRAILSAFVRASTPPLEAGAEGALGEINAPIRPDAVGEVIFTLEGFQRNAPARSLDGSPLPRGTKVVIVRREHGIAWVTPLDALASLPEGATLLPDAKQTTEPGAAREPHREEVRDSTS